MRPESILFVDDNDLLRSVMQRFFAKEFRQVIAVATGTEAIQQIREGFYHIIILDKKLPDIDGLDLLDQIREESPHSRVVMITSNAEESIRLEALKRGAFEFFEKPFDIDKLRAAVRGLRIYKTLQAKIDEKHPGLIHNFSESGMLVRTDAVFQSGATVDVLLHVADNRKIPLKGRVVRTVDSSTFHIPGKSPFSEKDMKYAVGMQLINPPAEYYSFVESLTL